MLFNKLLEQVLPEEVRRNQKDWRNKSVAERLEELRRKIKEIETEREAFGNF